jgi:hypothetical protein
VTKRLRKEALRSEEKVFGGCVAFFRVVLCRVVSCHAVQCRVVVMSYRVVLSRNAVVFPSPLAKTHYNATPFMRHVWSILDAEGGRRAHVAPYCQPSRHEVCEDLLRLLASILTLCIDAIYQAIFKLGSDGPNP